jgi:hypothetical protein
LTGIRRKGVEAHDNFDIKLIRRVLNGANWVSFTDYEDLAPNFLNLAKYRSLIFTRRNPVIIVN